MTERGKYRTLKALPLTAARFEKFGDVLEAEPTDREAMNSARFERFSDLAKIDTGPVDDGRTSLSIARCRTATALPYRVDMLERHPLGSQAFMPLGGFSFVLAVAPAGESVDPECIEAFVTNGRQGINYRKGVWHMPMIGLREQQEFLIIDRLGGGANCDEQYLDEPFLLEL